MEKIEYIQLITEKFIDLLEFQCDFYKFKFKEVLENVINEIKNDMITDEEYEKRKKEKDYGKK